MKYLNKSFSSRHATPEYRDNHAATFGEQRKVCGWCQDTGQYIRVVDELGIRMVSEPCPKGCEAPKG